MSFINNVFHWLQLHYPEVLAVITGILYVVFTIREKVILWAFGIISSALYIYVFLNSGIYAYAALYVYYVVIGFYGWVAWSRKKDSQNSNKPALEIHTTPAPRLAACILAVIVLTIPVYLALVRFTSSDMAFTDAFLTSGGMVATWMLTRKQIEQWIFWIIIDLVSFAAMIYKELYPSALLFLVYALLAVKGYIEWKKELSVNPVK